MRWAAFSCAALAGLGCQFDVTYRGGDGSPTNSDGGDALRAGLVGYWPFDDDGSLTAIDHGPGGFDGTLVHGAVQVPDGRIGGAYDYGGNFGAGLINSNFEFDENLDSWQITGTGTATVSFPVIDGSKVLAFSDIVPGEFLTPQLQADFTMEANTRYQWRIAGRCQQAKMVQVVIYDPASDLPLETKDWTCRNLWTEQAVQFANGAQARTVRAYAKFGADTTEGYFDNATVYIDELPGLQPRMTAESAPSLAGLSAASWCAWVHFEDGLLRTDDARIISRAPGIFAQNADWELLAHNMNLWALRLRTGTGEAIEHRASDLIPTGTWTHVCATYSAEAERVTIYQDGTEVLAAVQTGPIADDTAGLFEIGNNGHSPNSRMFPGRIDEVRIYDRALSPAEVADLRDWTGP